MKFAEQLGSNLAYCRRRAKLSQEEVSLRAAIHHTAVSQIEHGKRVPKADTLVKLAGALGVPPEELLDGLMWSPGGYDPGGFTELGD
jgi:transcriptional regulator with XRE-family HTH domain